MMRQNKESIQKAMKEGVQLDYAGILDGTYVKPTGRNLPEFSLSDVSNLWKTLGARWRIFKQDRWARIQDMVALRYSGRWTVKPPLQIVKKKEVKDIAKQFHEEIYTAFAAGDLGPVKDKLAPGFYESLINHMREQRRDTVRQWRIERYVREPKVCSYRLAVMPAEGAAAKKSKAEQAANAYGMIQAVVRIHTVQSMLTRQKKRVWDEVTRSTKTQLVPLNQRGVEISEAGAEEVRKAGAKETVEYFVIQRKFVHSKPQEWQAWGTTVESTPEKLKADAGIRRAKERQLEQERKAGRL
jgi:protein MBA1